MAQVLDYDPALFAGAIRLSDMNNGDKVRLQHFIVTPEGKCLKIANFPAVYILSNKGVVPSGVNFTMTAVEQSREAQGMPMLIANIFQRNGPDAYSAPELLANKQYFAVECPLLADISPYLVLTLENRANVPQQQQQQQQNGGKRRNSRKHKNNRSSNKNHNNSSSRKNRK
jgi:hypothetical protein